MQQPSIENRDPRQYQILIRLVIGLLAVCLLMPICLHYDLVVAREVNYLTLPGDLRTILSCAEVFGHLYGVAFILLAIWLSAPGHRRQLRSIVVLLLVNSAVITVLKNSVMRIRPRGGQAAQFETVWETFQGINPAVADWDFSQIGISNLQSYPSGHASTAFVLGLGLAITFPHARYLFLLFSCLACGQRIGFQAHYLSDVCAGVAIAILMYLVVMSTQRGSAALLGSPRTFPVVTDDQKVDHAETRRGRAA